VDLHCPHIEKAGGEFRRVKTAKDFDDVDGFILPGGESTTMLKLIDRFGLWESLAKNFAAKPVWGICAGAILMAQTVTNPDQKSFGLLPMTVERNAYGTQADSHGDVIEGYQVSFIRAPVFTDVANDINVLASHQGRPAWVQKGTHMASAFHPEINLDAPSPMHKAFLDLF